MLTARGPQHYLQPLLVARVGGGADLFFELRRVGRTHRQFGSFPAHAQGGTTASPLTSYLYRLL
jgi:hypothetical protein